MRLMQSYLRTSIVHIACTCDLALGITFRVICGDVSNYCNIFTLITIEMHAGYLINIFTTKSNSHTAQ